MATQINYQKIGYFTQKGLKERGWTYGAIDRFLGAPDKLYKHPRRKNPTHRYNYDRVIETEETEEFQEWYKSNLEAMSKDVKKV